MTSEQEVRTTEQETGEVLPPQEDYVRVREALEVIKTAVVWLVVINILTVLSPLLRVPLKWTLVVGILLSVGSLVIGWTAYLRARATQRRLPD